MGTVLQTIISILGVAGLYGIGLSSAQAPLRVLAIPVSSTQTECPALAPSARTGGSTATVRIGLAAPRDYGVLVLDRNRNGVVDDPSELVSNRTTPRSTGGFDALIELALARGPSQSELKHGHPLFHELSIWVDDNANGFSEPSELKPLDELLAIVGLGMELLPPGGVCRFKGWSVTRHDWTGSLKASDRLHPIFEVSIPQRP